LIQVTGELYIRVMTSSPDSYLSLYLDDDLTVELDMETARRLHKCWQTTQQRRRVLSSSAPHKSGTLARCVFLNERLGDIF